MHAFGCCHYIEQLNKLFGQYSKEELFLNLRNGKNKKAASRKTLKLLFYKKSIILTKK